MEHQKFVLVSDRGGHLHNAKMLIQQMDLTPTAILTTTGPEIQPLLQKYLVFVIPTLFTFLGKVRILNPFKVFFNFVSSFWYVMGLRPAVVISLGATNVVFFCYWARLFGAKIIHVECMNQVTTRSATGRLLYPVCFKFYVQWKELLLQYGPKAEYAGWVL